MPLQFAAGAQFSLGKSRRGYGPIGPWRRRASTSSPTPTTSPSAARSTARPCRTHAPSDLVFDVPRLVAELSAVLPLLPGDVIFTGTPSGVGDGPQTPALPAPRRRARDLDRRHRHDPEPVRLMGTYAHAFGPHAPDATYLPARLRGAPGRHRRRRLVELRHAGSNEHARAPADPWADASPGGVTSRRSPCSPSTSRSSPSTCAAKAGRPRTPGATRSTTWATTSSASSTSSIGRPTFVSGLSSGGVLSAWLSAYAKPGQVLAARLRGPAVVRSRGPTATCGQSIRQSIGPMFALWGKYLGDQWSIGDWDGDGRRRSRRAARCGWPALFGAMAGAEPPQNLKEYDPEWGRAFWDGTVAASCDHARMLRRACRSRCCSPTTSAWSTRRPAR